MPSVFWRMLLAQGLTCKAAFQVGSLHSLVPLAIPLHELDFHFLLLKFMGFSSDHFSSLHGYTAFCYISCSSQFAIISGRARVHPAPSSKSLLRMFNRIEPTTGPCDAPAEWLWFSYMQADQQTCRIMRGLQASQVYIVYTFAENVPGHHPIADDSA